MAESNKSKHGLGRAIAPVLSSAINYNTLPPDAAVIDIRAIVFPLPLTGTFLSESFIVNSILPSLVFISSQIPTPRSKLYMNRCFRGMYYLHIQVNNQSTKKPATCYHARLLLG
jgi:hypothetical protein